MKHLAGFNKCQVSVTGRYEICVALDETAAFQLVIAQHDPALKRNVDVSTGPWKLARGAIVGKLPFASLRGLIAILEVELVSSPPACGVGFLLE